MPTWLLLGPALWLAGSLLLFAIPFVLYVREERRENSQPPCPVFDLDDYRERVSWR